MYWKLLCQWLFWAFLHFSLVFFQQTKKYCTAVISCNFHFSITFLKVSQAEVAYAVLMHYNDVCNLSDMACESWQELGEGATATVLHAEAKKAGNQHGPLILFTVDCWSTGPLWCRCSQYWSFRKNRGGSRQEKSVYIVLFVPEFVPKKFGAVYARSYN